MEGPLRLPDEAAFGAFRAECEAEQGWLSRYRREGMAVWGKPPRAEDPAVHRVKGRIHMPDVPAETAYDVLHDTEYRKKWDLNVLETHEIARLSDNADKYPPRKDLVRAVSLLTGYLVQSTGPNSCSLTYLAQVDPKGSLPKWVVNKASQYLAPKLMKKLHKACLKYTSWKQEHHADTKPWLYPEQNQLPYMAISDLSLQHASSLENIDESSLMEARDEKGDTSGSEN
ncbi:START domain-containing protein 10 isoform X1 [Pogona vitticeps]